MELIRNNIETFGQKRGRPYAESSIQTYLRNINKVYTNIHPDSAMTDMEWAKDIPSVDKSISDFKPTTQRNYYNSIIIGMMALNTADDVRNGWGNRNPTVEVSLGKG